MEEVRRGGVSEDASGEGWCVGRKGEAKWVRRRGEARQGSGNAWRGIVDKAWEQSGRAGVCRWGVTEDGPG